MASPTAANVPDPLGITLIVGDADREALQTWEPVCCTVCISSLIGVYLFGGLLVFTLCVQVFACIWVVHRVRAWYPQKTDGASNPLELEFETIVGYLVGAGK